MSKVIENSQYVVLKKLQQIGKPMNMLEIGFSATPPVIRNMAARGMIKVTVELTGRGAAYLDMELIRRVRKSRRERHADERKVAGGTL